RGGGVADAVVVIRGGDAAIAAEIAAAGFGRAVVNPRAEEGQLTSLIAGLDAVDAPGVPAVLVTLVDIPLVAPATIGALCARAGESSASIVRAVHRGEHGHPVIFKRGLFEALRRADPAVGAKEVVRAAVIEDVEVDDPGITEDVDTPDDYARLIAP
ncbi:MAG TPA: NTP transferase domain-containing protein, partial [Vicinamibacterales bacterium]|nr:NTP transferase domain-containing protein [Vicinamibacterales bacterium]